MKALQSQEKRRESRKQLSIDRVLDLEVESRDKIFQIKALVQDESSQGYGLIVRHHLFLEPNLKLVIRLSKTKKRAARVAWVQGCDTVIARIGIEFI